MLTSKSGTRTWGTRPGPIHNASLNSGASDSEGAGCSVFLQKRSAKSFPVELLPLTYSVEPGAVDQVLLSPRVLTNFFHGHSRTARLQNYDVTGCEVHGFSLRGMQKCEVMTMICSRHMSDEEEKLVPEDHYIEAIKAELQTASPSRRRRILQAIGLAALGSIPWVGGVVSAAAAYRSEGAQSERDDIIQAWLQEYQEKLAELRLTLVGMAERLDGFGEEVEDRIHSHSYLNLVRKTFRQWDEADTAEKRQLLVALITNAAGTRVCSDDILRLFLDWIDLYHEAHFAVIREIHKNQGPTRYDIWVAVYGEPVPRDDSAEADLYKLLVRDLSLGSVIRQSRDSDYRGRFLKKTRPARRVAASNTMESPFEDTKQYVLTDLGSQFVHYTMTELVPRLDASHENE